MMIKALFRYMRVRSSEGSTWAGLSVLGLFLNQLTGFDLDPVLGVLAQSVPMLLTGNYVGFLIVVLPAIVAVLKQDKPDYTAPPNGAANVAQAVPPMPPRGPPQPPSQPQPQPGGFPNAT